MLNRLRQNKGFTLIELFVAFLIMAITGAVLYYMFSQGQVLMMEQEHRQKVFEAAQKRMTVYKLLSDQRHIDGGTFRGTETIEIEKAVPEIGAPAVNVSTRWVTNITPGSNIYTIEITYTWTELSGREYDVFLKTDFPVRPYGGH